ncbi:MAG: hypothetical protein QW559_01270 [Candidatus Woesearchaeota archaeon]
MVIVMVDETPSTEPSNEYELVPYKEIKEMQEELAKIKEFPSGPARRMQISMDQLAAKLDKLIAIFEEAMHELRVEEGGLSFQEKMKPLMDRMSKILDQNAEIASGIVALADLINELKQKVERIPSLTAPPYAIPPSPRPMPAPVGPITTPQAPTSTAPAPPGLPPPPIPPKRR